MEGQGRGAVIRERSLPGSGDYNLGYFCEMGSNCQVLFSVGRLSLPELCLNEFL